MSTSTQLRSEASTGWLGQGIDVGSLHCFDASGEAVSGIADAMELETVLRAGEIHVIIAPTSIDRDPLLAIDPLVQILHGVASPSAELISELLKARQAGLGLLIRSMGGTPSGDSACRPHDELIGGGEAMSGLRNRLRQVAEHDVPSLVHGPLGTPVEATARWLHMSSPRADGPLVAVDCDSGLESQVLGRLFGYAPGAFPGTEQPQVAAVMAARGGTLLLRSLDRASQSVQERVGELLRDGAWCAVGDRHWRTADLRVVLAMDQPPVQAVMRGHLSRQVLDRVGSHVIRVPALRDRLEDFEELLNHQLKRAAARMGRRPPALPTDVVSVLAEAPWAGNDREFAAICERLVLYGQGVELDPAMVRDWAGSASLDSAAPEMVCDGSGRMLADIERESILATLQHYRGHRRRAAAALGIGVRTLGLKLRQWKDAAIIPESL
ncbi:MAG: sigma 54-interacting transcriptional regulator [Phycisphaerales bacterium]|nr:sigma 54-interacting transcriptional regulator [Phycisphaerales bacterium]